MSDFSCMAGPPPAHPNGMTHSPQKPALREGTRTTGHAQTNGRSPVPVAAIEHTIRHTTLRALGFVGMLGIALIQLLDVIGKIKETPYLGVMYIGLMVAS